MSALDGKPLCRRIWPGLTFLWIADHSADMAISMRMTQGDMVIAKACVAIEALISKTAATE